MVRAVLLSVVLVSAFTDKATGLIYNRILLLFLAMGVAAVAVSDISLLPARIAAVFVMFGLLLPVYLIGGIGAGDVKLLCMAALLQGMDEAVLCAALSFCLAVIPIPFLLILYRRAHETGEHMKIRFAVPVFVSEMFLLSGMTAV